MTLQVLYYIVFYCKIHSWQNDLFTYNDGWESKRKLELRPPKLKNLSGYISKLDQQPFMRTCCSSLLVLQLTMFRLPRFDV